MTVYSEPTMSDETKVYLCALIGERMSDLNCTMADHIEGSEEYENAQEELTLALIALEEL